MGVWGGGEKQFYEISRRVAKRGNNVTVLTCKFPGQSAEEVVDGIKIHRVGLSRDHRSGSARKALIPILDYIAKTSLKALELKPEIIHCNTYFPVYSGEIASRVKGIPVVTTFHDVYGVDGWIRSQNSFIWGHLGNAATIVAARISDGQIIAVSPQCRDKLISIGINRNMISIIPNGVDLKLFDSINVNKVPHQVLYVGRLVNFKHVDQLILAFIDVLKEVKDARLKIVGDGPEKEALLKLVKKHDLVKHVTFTGRTSSYEEVALHFKESEVFVLPSTVEGEAIALKEAMAAELPVIAMNVTGSGVLSIVRDNRNGYLVKPSEPKLIAAKIVELLLDPCKGVEMGREGRSMVERFDWDVVASMTCEVYNRALSP